MPAPILPTCPIFGRGAGRESAAHPLPADTETNPFHYLPPRITLSAEEIDLAERYNRCDFSGGYVASQIAFFRRGPSPEQHQRRRAKFRQIKAEVDRLGLVLPPAYVELVESDDAMSRLRHNNIWLRIPDEIVPLPSAPEHLLYLIFYESQGCAYWHLLLSPDGSHIVTTSDEPIGLSNQYPRGHQPDPATWRVYRCADNFSQWIVHYFAACIESDRHYEQTLSEFPGM